MTAQRHPAEAFCAKCKREVHANNNCAPRECAAHFASAMRAPDLNFCPLLLAAIRKAQQFVDLPQHRALKVLVF